MLFIYRQSIGIAQLAPNQSPISICYKYPINRGISNVYDAVYVNWYWKNNLLATSKTIPFIANKTTPSKHLFLSQLRPCCTKKNYIRDKFILARSRMY